MFKVYLVDGTPSWERVPADYEAHPGEVLLPESPTLDDLGARFPDAVMAAAAKERCRAVDELREAKFATGMDYGGKVLQLRDVDQQRIIAAGAQAKFALITQSPWPEGFGWIMADNTLLPLSAAGMSAMADAAASQVQAWIFTGHAHKQEIRALTDVASIEAYDIESGW